MGPSQAVLRKRLIIADGRFPQCEEVLDRSPRQGEPHLETRLTGLGTHLNISPVLLHNSLHCVQAEARSFANSFGGEKRFEDVGLHFSGNSWTIVGDLNHSTTVV